MNDEYGILGERGEDSFPYYALKLTPEQAEAVKGKTAGIYEIEGKQLFDIKPSLGKPNLGEKMLFVVFV